MSARLNAMPRKSKEYGDVMGSREREKAFPATITIVIRGRNAGLSGNGEAASASRERIATAARPLLETDNRRYSATCTGSVRHKEAALHKNGLPIAPRRAE